MKKLFRILLLSTLFVGAIAVLSPSDDKNTTRTTIVQLKKQAEMLSRSDDYTKAIEKLKEGLKLSRDLHDGNLTLDLLQAIGNAYSRQFVMASAIEYFKRALELAEDMEDTGKQFFLSARIGKAFGYLGDHESAVDILKKALSKARKKDSKEWIERILNDIGVAYYNSGLFQDALESYLKAVDVALSMNGKGHEGYIYINMGEIYRRTKNYQKAEEYYKKASDYALKNKVENLEWASHRALGMIDYESGRYREALKHYDAALEYIRKTGEKTSIAGTLNAKAKVHLVLGELSEAEKLFELSRVLYRESGSINVMHPINYLGDILFQSGRYDESLKHYRESLKIAQSLKSFNYIIEMNFKIGRAYEGKKEFKKALNHYFNAINEVESIRAHIGGEKLKTGFMSGYLEIYERAVALLLNLHEKSPHKGHNKEAFHLAEKAKARAFLDSLQEARIDLPSGMISKEKEKLNELKHSISRILTKLQNSTLTTSQRKDLFDALDAAEEKYEQDIEHIRRRNPLYGRIMYPQPLGVEELQDRLLDGKTALVEYMIGDRHSFVFLLSKNGLWAEDLGPGQKLNEIVNNYVLTLISGSDNDFVPPGKKLYEILLKSVMNRMPEHIVNLIIVPDRNLYFLPFESLMEEGGRFLLERFNTAYSPSANMHLSLLQRTRGLPEDDFLGIADPLYAKGQGALGELPVSPKAEDLLRTSYIEHGFSFPRLIYSAKELKTVAKNFRRKRRQTLYRKRATEENIKSMDLKRFKIVHFATHGFIDDTIDGRSAVVLSLDDDPAEDGFLQAREIYNLELDADMVVLSACQTGKGKMIKGEGVSGLYRAFLYAGSHSVLASLWNIRDKSTSFFMKSFYHFLSKGLPKQEALKKAKLEMIHSGYDHPSAWAAFILIGDSGSPVNIKKPGFLERLFSFL